MPRIAVTYSPEVGGSSVHSAVNASKAAGAEVEHADYRKVFAAISEAEFEKAYQDPKDRTKLFAHAKAIASDYLDNIDALIISGNSAEIDPDLWGGERHEHTHCDYSRTVAEMALLHAAIQKGIPVFGICGGHQLVTVYKGGRLIPITEDQFKKQVHYDYVDITIEADSELQKILYPEHLQYPNRAKGKKITTHKAFGAHSQVINSTVGNFKSSATDAATGTNEAQESMHGAPLLTVQFHPDVESQGFTICAELYKQQDEVHRDASFRIFKYLKTAAETRNNRRKLNAEFLEKYADPIVKEETAQPDPLKTSVKEYRKKHFSGKNQKKRYPNMTKLAIIAVSSIVVGTLFGLFPPFVLTSTLVYLGTVKLTVIATSIGCASGILLGGLIAYSKQIFNGAVNGLVKLFPPLGTYIRRITAQVSTMKFQKKNTDHIEALYKHDDTQDKIVPKHTLRTLDTPEKILLSQPACLLKEKTKRLEAEDTYTLSPSR